MQTGGAGTFNLVDDATAATYRPTVTTVDTYAFKRMDFNTTCSGEAFADGTAKLLIAERPTVTITPEEPHYICYNGLAGTLTATVNGGLPAAEAAYSYIWERFSDVDGDWVTPSNNKASTYTLPFSTILATTYRYRVSVTGKHGCSPEEPTTHSVTVFSQFKPGAYIESELSTVQNQIPAPLDGGNTASGGSGSYTYKWYKCDENGDNCNSIETSASSVVPTYTLTTDDVANKGKITFYLKTNDDLCDGGGATYTRKWVVTVGDVNTTYVKDTSVCNNKPYALTSGIYSPATYTWYESANGDDGWKEIPNVPSSNILNRDGTPVAGTYYYKVRIRTDQNGTKGEIIWSNVATVTVYDVFSAGSFSARYNSGYVCPGGIASPIDEDGTQLSPVTGGSGKPTYQWYYQLIRTSGTDSERVLIPDATAATYQPSRAQTALGTGNVLSIAYFREVLDLCGTYTTGGSYTLKFNRDGDIGKESIIPTVQTVCDGGTIAVAAKAVHTYYIWYEVKGGVPHELTGETSQTLTIP
jgi:hypothetical protein